MKCGKCGKEFQTYNGICPFCHSKNEKDAQEQPTIKYTPIVKPNPQYTVGSRNPTENTSPYTPVKPAKTPDNTVKYVLTSGIVLLVVILAAATVQSFIGGSSSPSNPDIYTAPTATDEPVPSLAPIASLTQPKITYSGSNAGTLSPYSGDSDPVNPNPPAPIYVAPGHRSTPGMTSTDSSSTGSDGRSTVVYVTPIPTTIVTVSPPNAVEPLRSQPAAVKPVSSPPKVVEPVSSPPKVVEPPSSPSEPMEPSPVVKGEIFSFSLKGERIGHSFLVLDVKPGEYEWYLTYQRVYENPQTGSWYLVSSDEKREGGFNTMWYEDGFQPHGEVLNIDTVPIQPNYIQPVPRFGEGDIVKVRENDGKWNTYYISSYYDYNIYDIYYTQIIVPKEDGTWGYLDSTGVGNIDPHRSRQWIDASSNSRVAHLNSQDGLEWISPPLPIYTLKPPTPTPTQTPTSCSTGCVLPIPS